MLTGLHRVSVPAGTILIAAFLPYCLPDPAQGAQSSIIAAVSVVGNDHVGSLEITDWLSSREDLALVPEIVQQDSLRIIENYRPFGFFGVTVDSVGYHYSSDRSLVDIIFHLSEGKQTLVGTVEVSGNIVFDAEQIAELFLLDRGDPFNETTLEEDIAALLVKYERVGYPLTGCEISDLIRREGDTEDTIDVDLAIDEGPIVTIDEIRVQGNSETDAGVIVRETRVRPGELYDPTKTERIRQRLRRLNIFSSVSEPELYLREELGGLLIKVQEGNTNAFDGVIGYIPGSSADEKGFVTGLISISMRNLFGTGRKFSFRWQREDRFSQELGIRYLEPWVMSLPVNLGVGFYQRQQDTTYVLRMVDPKAELMVTEEFSISLFYVSESVIPQEDDVGNRVLRTTTGSFGGELLYDTRDDLFAPTSGARYRTDVQVGTKKTTDIPPELTGKADESVRIRRFGLDLDFYLPTFNRQIAAIGLHGRELQGDQIDEAQMYRFGGTNSLRGYREKEFLGSRIAWTNVEYRLFLSHRSFLYGFLDGGYYFRPEDTLRNLPSAEAFKYGYGIGVQVETGLGHLGVSYALGQDDSFSTGKIHFGLISEF